MPKACVSRRVAARRKADEDIEYGGFECGAEPSERRASRRESIAAADLVRRVSRVSLPPVLLTPPKVPLAAASTPPPRKAMPTSRPAQKAQSEGKPPLAAARPIPNEKGFNAWRRMIGAAGGGAGGGGAGGGAIVGGGSEGGAHGTDGSTASLPALERALSGLGTDADSPLVPISASALLVRVVFAPAVAALGTPADPRCQARRYLIGALTELLHSLQRHARMADEEAGALLLDLLAEQGSYFQVHQYVQYNVVPDSPRLVAQLFTLAPAYPPAAALAVDILRRLGASANEAIIDWMLHHGELLTACRFIRQQGLLAHPPRPLLDAAAACNDPQVFTTVFGFLLQRNEVWRGDPAFLPEEGCEVHVRRWNTECSGEVVSVH